MSPSALLAQTTTSTSIANPAAEAISSLTDLSNACGTDPSWACRWIYDWTGSDAWAGVADWVLAKPLAIVVIVVVAWLASRILRAVAGRVITRLARPAQSERLRRLRARAPAGLVGDEDERLRAEARANTLATVGRSLVTGFVWFAALIAILDVLEINLGPFLAGAGIIGVALGFGAQTMVRDYLNGIFLVIEDQYGVGDWVDLGPDAQGVVERVTLRSTRLRAFDGTVWHVPNGEVTRVGNSTQDYAYAVLDLGVALGVDLGQVERLVVELAGELADDPDWSTDVIGRPDLWGVNTLTPQGATVRLLLKTAPGAQWRVQRELRSRVKQAFDERGITSSLAGQPAPLTFDGPDAANPFAGGGETPEEPGPGGPATAPAETSRTGESAVTRDSLEVAAQLERGDER